MFEAIHERAQKGGITLAEFFALLSGRGHQLVILFLALPFLQPIPLIGVSTPLGFLIGVVGWLHYRDQAPWVPRRFQKLEISQRVLNRTVEVGQKFWQIADRLKMHPRWFFVLDTKIFRILNLLLVMSLGFLLALPLPVPFSNTVPAICLVIHSLGQIRRDGLLVVLSYFLCLVVGIFFWSVAELVFSFFQD
jgi:hypothetical protein